MLQTNSKLKRTSAGRFKNKTKLSSMNKNKKRANKRYRGQGK